MAHAISEVAPPTEDPLPVPEPLPIQETVELPALASDASCEFSGIPTDASSNNASFTSTPPTTIDAASIASDSSKHDIPATLPTLDDPTEPIEHMIHVGTPQPDLQTPQPPTPTEIHEDVTPKRARAARSGAGTPVYNLAKLAGTHIHGKRRAKGDHVREPRRRTLAGGELAAGNDASLDSIVRRVNTALDMDWSLSAPNSPRSAKGGIKSKSSAKNKKEKKKAAPAVAPRISTRSSGAAAAAAALISVATSLGKRARKTTDHAAASIPRELRRLQDTNEFAGIEAKPVLHTIWSNGKYIDPNDLDEEGEPVRKKAKKSPPPPPKEPEPEPSKEPTPTVPTQQRRVKKWLGKGLYAGQDTPSDWAAGLNTADKKKLAQLPELTPPEKPNKTLPFPIFNGLRLLLNGRDFKLPFDVCNPLPPGQPKPDEWRKMTKNRFVGDAGTYWRKTDHFKDYQSKCVCKPQDGCAEDCQNRIMLYECDEMNCNLGKEYCQNRAFQNLAERTKKGGRYRVGVEVVKTEDRGHGVRSNRCFEPNQIIMEYTGEIITEAECERRMNEKYKDNECYYLMAFDQNMIIDATTGSIARFVNHSCNPNCRMEKWIVHGQPRMALFAGDKPIMTGEELTYDYNFDPFSAKNVQKCLCGSANCRGILGPKVSKVAKSEAKNVIKETVKAATKAGKRKLKALIDGEDAGASPNKKRKIAKATGVKPSLAKATAAVKKTANSISVNAKAAIATSKAKTKAPAQTVSVRKATLIKASKTYVKNGKQLLLADSLTKNGTTIVASPKGGASGKKKTAGPAKGTVKKKATAKTTAKAKASAKPTAKTAKSGGTIKATIKSAGVKGSIQSTIKTAKHTINKAAGKKTIKKTVKKSTIKTTTTTKRKAKASVLEADESIEQEDSPAAAVGGSISVKGPRNAMDLSHSHSMIRLVTSDE